MQKSALISIRSFVIYITRISTYHASYYSNTPSHLNNFSCVDVTRMYNMIFSSFEGNSFFVHWKRKPIQMRLGVLQPTGEEKLSLVIKFDIIMSAYICS